MSAVMTITERDCVHLVCDASIYDENGILLWTVPKALPIPGINAVFATRGPVVAYLAFLSSLEEFDYSSFDDLRRQIEHVGARCDEMLGEDRFELIIAGWSDENNRGEVLFRQTHGASWHETEPHAVYLMGDRAGFGVASADRWDRDLVLQRFEETRAHPADLSCGRDPEPTMGFAVGGYVWHAVVRRGSMPEFEIMRQWDDVLGERINSRPALAA